VKRALCGFADSCKSVREQVVQGLAGCKSGSEFSGLAAEGGIVKTPDFFFSVVDLPNGPGEEPQQSLIATAKKLR
jgi:hypothetical protein